MELRLPEDAVLRGWRSGDRIQPAGMSGHKKVQDYYVDRKVARRERLAAPVIACNREVAWTPFGPVAVLKGAGESVDWSVRWRRVEGGGGGCEEANSRVGDASGSADFLDFGWRGKV